MKAMSTLAEDDDQDFSARRTLLRQDPEKRAMRRSRGYRAEMAPFGPLSPLRAVRMKCGECMGGERGKMPVGEVAAEIECCGSVGCTLWPFRFGDNPFRAERSEAQKAAAAKQAERLKGSR